MPALPVPASVALLVVLFLVQDRPIDCATWAECREQAQAAAAAEDYERFHDLAWLAVRKGPRNHPELMLMLARAQSLSGRPLDALVMLRRLADLGVATNAAIDEDFRRVRALPGWADLERAVAGLPPAASPAAPEPTAAAAAPGAKVTVVPPPPVVVVGGKPASPGAGGVELLRFRAPPFTPAGLAYDHVSRRFIVGDRRGQRLAVIDEFSHQLSTLAGARGPGFGDLAALEIDPRDGTLWVISQPDQGSRLHKLQLISARSLAIFEPPGVTPPARFVDVALAERGTVLVLDAGARRILRLPSGGVALQVSNRLGDRVPHSIAPAAGNVAYVAHDTGLARLEIGGGEAADVKAPGDVMLTGLVRVRWHDRSIVGIQKTTTGHRAVRLRLARDGRSVTALDVLDADIETADPSAASLVADALYYLAPGEEGMVIRRVALRE
ncbi:MAG: hypothetical protein H0X67_11165 [Acidobacteria bacterium]|nr:hypothetical protein [Acidobacteriota bacterium]